jgi:hypothetical protein
MPQAAAMAVYWAAAAAGSYTAAAVLVASIAAAVTYTVVALTISYALNVFESALSGKPSNNRQPVPQGFTVRSSTYPRSIIYGKTRSSGVAVYEYTLP